MRHLVLAFGFFIFCSTLNADQNDPHPALVQMKQDNPNLGHFLDELTNFQTKELRLVAASKHATRFRFQTDEGGVIFQNRPVVILVHGLFDSPVTMEKLENYAYESGAHVISLRLPGHHEKDPTNLDRVSADEWYQAVQQSVSWASNLSQDVTLIGHSAGGLLAFGVAAEHTNIVKHVILLSPALNINWENSTEAIFFANLGVSGSFLDFLSGQNVKDDDNYQSSFAGRELLKLESSLANAPLASTHQLPSVSYGRQIELLKKTEVFWFGTEEDDTLDREKNKLVLQEMKANGDDVKRFIFRRDLHIKHEDLPLLTDTEKTLILDAIQSILRKSNAPVRPLRAPSSLSRYTF